MKMTYERPMMQAELFQADNFCLSACRYDPHLNAKLKTSEEWEWFSPRTPDGTVQKTVLNVNDLKDDGFSLVHEFKVNDTHHMLSEAEGYEGNAQYYWYCSCDNCDDNNRYYMEYSVEWADHYGTDTFVLYRERDGSPGLDINWGTWYWPDNDYNQDSWYDDASNDQAIAAFTVPYSVVNYSA